MQALYKRHPQVKTLARAIANEKVRALNVSGLQASAAPLVFSAVSTSAPLLFILDDMEEAGYFYHDLVQILDEKQVLFFPSSFRRAVKFGQRDAANEILRTEVLAKTLSPLPRDGEGLTIPEQSSPTRSLSFESCAPAVTPPSREGSGVGLMIVTYPEAIAERVVSKKTLDDRTLQLRVGEEVDITFVEQTLLAFGFQRTDYVYEPGQFAVRGSLVDVFSFSSEYPYRIDFFGDEVDSIRSFEVESQLSRGQQELITLVPDLSEEQTDTVPFADLLPEQTIVVSKDITFVAQRIGQIWEEGFSQQALIAERDSPQTPPVKEGSGQRNDASLSQKERLLIDAQTFEKGFASFKRVELSSTPLHDGRGKGVGVSFSTTPQPLFHKNFELVTKTFEDYLA